MRYIKPHYYDAFVCLAGSRPATCCAGWQIVIDEESLDRYGNVKGDFGGRLHLTVPMDMRAADAGRGSAWEISAEPYMMMQSIPKWRWLYFPRNGYRRLSC